LGVERLGREVNLRADGTLDADDEDLVACEVVVASLHSGLDHGRERLTARVLRAIEHPCVQITGHPTGGFGPGRMGKPGQPGCARTGEA
jgi:histidinol phosphatase-like PHP family hydrolase